MPDDKKDVLHAAKEATADWLVDSGKIGHRDELDLNKKIVDYGITVPDFSKMSEDIAVKIKRSTGHEVSLPEHWQKEIHSKTLADFVRALPGESGTLPSHPGRLPGRTVSPPPPGKSTIPASRPGPLPGKKRPSGSSSSENSAS